MLTLLTLPQLTISGVSVGGVYTTLHVPALDSIFDIGLSPRSNVGAGHLFLSHSHADHVGSLPLLMGIRGLSGQPVPRIFAPVESAEDLKEGVLCFNRGQRRALDFEIEPVSPGDEIHLYGDLWVRAFRTLHSVPSLGYLLFRRVPKLKPEYVALAGAEIAVRRKAGEALFSDEERLEFAYATDTLIDVLDENPELYRCSTLVLESTFLDEQKGKEHTRQKCHVHLDEIIERASLFRNEHLVLMHFSQIYSPAQVHDIMKRRLPAELLGKVKVFAPQKGPWPG